ncbi:MAG: TROVE domain-containing protein, partial [Acidobacteria bacterium]|nr:TROVE domain-containing protein [Acidobacteriota bacterium]
MQVLKSVHGVPAPQSEPMVGREAEMVRNAAGGYVFPVTDWTRLERFLILGSDAGTYYAGARALTLDNAGAVRRCLAADGPRTVRTLVDVSTHGRAPRNDPALFALAMAASFGDEDTRRAAAAALPRVARTGTHLLHFVSFVNDMRGWGRSLKRAVGRWYTDQEIDRLTHQVLKYRQRDGWSHRDVLRLTHPKAPAGGRLSHLLQWVTHPDTTEVDAERLPQVDALRRLQRAETAAEAAGLLRAHARALSREMVPTDYLGDPSVWRALPPNLPLTPLVRNLPLLTQIQRARSPACESRAAA